MMGRSGPIVAAFRSMPCFSDAKAKARLSPRKKASLSSAELIPISSVSAEPSLLSAIIDNLVVQRHQILAHRVGGAADRGAARDGVSSLRHGQRAGHRGRGCAAAVQEILPIANAADRRRSKRRVSGSILSASWRSGWALGRFCATIRTAAACSLSTCCAGDKPGLVAPTLSSDSMPYQTYIRIDREGVLASFVCGIEKSGQAGEAVEIDLDEVGDALRDHRGFPALRGRPVGCSQPVRRVAASGTVPKRRMSSRTDKAAPGKN